MGNNRFRLPTPRCMSPTNETYEVVSQILILLAPLWVNASAYMVMGRMVYYWLPDKKIWKIKARTLSIWFVWLDVGTFLVQATGGSMIDDTDPQSAKMGLDICECYSNPKPLRCCACCSDLEDLDRYGRYWCPAGFLILFVCLMISFHISVRRFGRTRPTSWRSQLYAQYVALSLITVSPSPFPCTLPPLTLSHTSTPNTSHRSALSSASSNSPPARTAQSHPRSIFLRS